MPNIIVLLTAFILAFPATGRAQGLPDPAQKYSRPSAPLSRDEIIDRKLNCFAQPDAPGLAWADVCYSPAAEIAAKERMEKINQALDAAAASPNNIKTDDAALLQSRVTVVPKPAKPKVKFIPPREQLAQQDAQPIPERISLEPERPAAKRSESPTYIGVPDLELKRHSFEMGGEAYFYHYKEPDVTVDIQGYMYGLYTNYEFRPDTNDGQIIDDVVNMYKLDAQFAYGLTDYSSDPSGTSDNIDDYTVEFRAAAGYDFLLTPRNRLTPYAGLGFRRLYDLGGGTTTSTGDLGYDRISNYLYTPIGLDVQNQFSEHWQISANLEADFLLWGRQDSALSTASTSYSDLRNKQRRGYGLRGSFKLLHSGGICNYLFEPFIRYWHIKNSDINSSVGPTGVTFTGYEPDNNTTEFGLKLGVQY